MYKNSKISAVVPAFNEETQILKVIDTMPSFVDNIIIINDCSKDKTKVVVDEAKKQNDKVILINHEENQGVGGAIATGYKWSRDNDIDIAVVMAGDAQMNPDDMPALLDEVIDGGVDYAKGNRLIYGDAYKIIPKTRFFGNSVLSFLTKIASGYWHIADSQTGYTAINKKGLKLIDWDSMYKRYGQPNDLLVKLNIAQLIVRDIPITPVYNVGEKSGIKISRVIFTISWLLLKLFFFRLKERYIIRDFHPLVLFYILGFVLGMASLFLFGRVFYFWLILGTNIPSINALAAFSSFLGASQFTLFAMWFDMEANKHLR